MGRDNTTAQFALKEGDSHAIPERILKI